MTRVTDFFSFFENIYDAWNIIFNAKKSLAHSIVNVHTLLQLYDYGL